MNFLPSDWRADVDGWILLIAVLAAIACAIPGSFLLIRRQSMLGDAISHAVLPGIALGFLVSGTRDSQWMFLGAAVAGVATAVFAQLLISVGRVDKGAALGIVFTTFFAIGLVLIVQTADRVDLDPSCVLYGQIEVAPLDTVELAGWEVPRAVLVLSSMLGVSILVMLIMWKELVISSFDPAVAHSQGIAPGVVQQVLMVLVAATCVAAFETVGSILVISLLVAPAAAARLLTDRLGVLLPLAAVLAAATALVGQFAALTMPGKLVSGAEDASIAGMIALTSGVLVFVAVIASPRRGVVSRWINVQRLRLRTVEEDLLGALYRREAEGRGDASLHMHLREIGAINGSPTRGSAWMLPVAKRQLSRRGLIMKSESPSLTSRGRVVARALVRTHRLWENYLADNVAMPSDHLHEAAMDLEHITSPELAEALENIAGEAALDPHGREIPDKTADNDYPAS